MSRIDKTIGAKGKGMIAAGLLALGSACSNEVSVQRSGGEAGDGGGSADPDASTVTSAASTGDASTATSSSSGGGDVSGTWSAASEKSFACDHHTATEIGPGKVLVVGACFLDDVEVAAVVYDLAARAFTTVAPLEPRSAHAAIALSDGRVAIAGGAPDVEVFDPSTNAFALVGPLAVARSEPMLVALANGSLWVLGGADTAGLALASTEFVDVGSGASFPGPSMDRGRYRAAALPISGGGVWVVGGESTDAEGSTEALDSTEWSGCGGCEFEPAGSIRGLAGAVAGIGIGGAFCDGTVDTGTVVFGTYALAWRGGGGFDAAIDLDAEVFMPGAARTPTDRFVAAGSAIYANETRVLEATPGAGARVVAARAGSGAWTTVTPLGGDAVLVVSDSAEILDLPRAPSPRARP